MATSALPILSTDGGGLSRYLNEIKVFPVLSAENEYMLAKRFKEHGESNAAHELVTSHLRLVAKIAMQYRGYGLPVADLISEGNLGLMKAVKKFEPDKGFRLSTYAMWWIKASVTEYILKSWSLVKMGTMAAQKKLFFSLRKAKRQLNIADMRDIDPESAQALSKKFGLSASDIINMDRRMTARDLSLNAPMSHEEDAMEFQDTLVDEGPSAETMLGDREEAKVRNSLLRSALGELTDRERHIFTERRLRDEPVTLEELGKSYGISRERVRQLENRAFEKVERSIRAAATAA